MSDRISNLRVLAILVVVLGHSIIIFDPQWSATFGYAQAYQSPLLVYVKKGINLFQMELFYMISGMCLYFTLRKSPPFGGYLLAKARRLLVPFSLIGLFWLIPLRFVARYAGYDGLDLLHIAKSFLLMRDCGHLWFLPVLFCLFAVSFIFHWVFKSRQYLLLPIALLLYAFSSQIASFLPRMTCFYLMFFEVGYTISYLYYNRDARREYLSFAIPFLLVAMVLVVAIASNVAIWSCLLSMAIILGLYVVAPTSTNSIIGIGA